MTQYAHIQIWGDCLETGEQGCRKCAWWAKPFLHFSSHIWLCQKPSQMWLPAKNIFQQKVAARHTTRPYPTKGLTLLQNQ